MLRTKIIIASALVFLTSMPTLAFFPSEKEAWEWCDSGMLTAVEGIWEYPDDGTAVLIMSDEAYPGSYSITILSTPDCRLQYGDIIGRLYPSADARQFKLEQYTGIEKLSLASLLKCQASLSADGEAIRVTAPKFKLRISPNSILPKFLRLVRLTYSNPADNVPAGMVKVYPGYDHNGSLKRKTRVL